MWPFNPLVILFGLVAPLASAALEKEWDFIIVGGGSAGLTLALRLSEIPSWKILVLEAGIDHAGDIKVMAPAMFGTTFGGDNSSYHWTHYVTPRKALNNRSHAIMAGKGLGGGSAINFMFWTHASRGDIDNWGSLNKNNKDIWSWEKFQPYLKKSETFIPPTAEQTRLLNLSFVDPSVHGYHGPIVNSFPGIVGPWSEAWLATFENLGLGVDGDPRGGRALGAYTPTFSVNNATKERSYPGSVYTSLSGSRPNLRVVTGALVTKVLFEKMKGSPRAVGVSYRLHGGSAEYKATAKKEVILSAGALASPKLLELSGVGDRKLLDTLGIKTVLDNRFVGENYQNHIMVPLGFAVEDDVPTGEDFLDPIRFQTAMAEYIANRTGPFTVVNSSSSLLSLCQLHSSDVSCNPTGFSTSRLAASKNSAHPGIKAQHKLILASLSSKNRPAAPVAHIISLAGGLSPWHYNDTFRVFASPDDGGRYFSLLALPQSPFSRGSVHITSSNPLTPPVVNSGDLSHPLDMAIAKATVLKSLKIASTPPLSDLLRHDKNGIVRQPGYPEITHENIEEFIRGYALFAAHYSGTCAMMDRKLGGVVDSHMRVYGVERLRVVDASIFPMVPGTAINSAVIGVAERAADFLKKDWGM